MRKIIYPAWKSARKPLSVFTLLTLLFIGGELLILPNSPRGLDFRSVLAVFLLPIGIFLLPISLVFYSFRIEVTDDEILFYMFFVPLRVVKLAEIQKIRYENWSDRRQPCVLTVIYPGARYSYPVKLFDRKEIDSIILTVSEKIKERDDLEASPRT